MRVAALLLGRKFGDPAPDGGLPKLDAHRVRVDRHEARVPYGRESIAEFLRGTDSTQCLQVAGRVQCEQEQYPSGLVIQLSDLCREQRVKLPSLWRDCTQKSRRVDPTLAERG